MEKKGILSDSLFLLHSMDRMKNIKLSISYDGSRYHGWQRQDNGMTVQEMVEEKIQTMTGVEVRLIASGRTDAGVHALHQICNFRIITSIPPDSLRKGLNGLLPDDIYISDAQYVPLDFHSRYNCKSKMYEYRILNREVPDIFPARICLAYPQAVEHRRHVALLWTPLREPGIFPVSNHPEVEIPILSGRFSLLNLPLKKEMC